MPALGTWRDEALPLVRPLWYEAQHILGSHDGKCVGAQRAVDGGDDKAAARLGQRRQRGAEARHVIHVLDHLAGHHRIEAQTWTERPAVADIGRHARLRSNAPQRPFLPGVLKGSAETSHTCNRPIATLNKDANSHNCLQWPLHARMQRTRHKAHEAHLP